MPLEIAYDLVGTGWSKCQVSDGANICKVTASYLSDALGNLVMSAIAVLGEYHSLAFGFDEEPGEYRWVVERAGNSDVSLQIVEFSEMWSGAANADGQVLFSTLVSRLDYANAIHDAASKVLLDHGLAGYHAKWVEHPFPEQHLTALREVLEKRTQ